MVGPYISVTELEIIKPWPIGGFLLANCRDDRATGRGAKASTEKQQVSPEVPERPEEGQKPEKGDDPIIKMPKELEGPEDYDSMVKVLQEPK